MQIIPVIDILNGVVVRGIAGERQKYAPINSMLTESRDPSVIVQVLQDEFGLTDFYVADLDAIQARRMNRCTIAELAQLPGKMHADCGVRTKTDIQDQLDLGVERVVVALETVASLDAASAMLQEFGSESLVFSVDMKNGKPLAGAEWGDDSPSEICRLVIDAGFERLILLDLSAVGTDGGTPTLELCKQVRNQFADVQIITGGGIRGVNDLQLAKDAGVDGLLVASALHDGRLTRDDWVKPSK